VKPRGASREPSAQWRDLCVLHSACLRTSRFQASILKLAYRQENSETCDQEGRAADHHPEKSSAELCGHLGNLLGRKDLAAGPELNRPIPRCTNVDYGLLVPSMAAKSRSGARAEQ
jgi:hypothetical protein